jgi:hypothetical protein
VQQNITASLAKERKEGRKQGRKEVVKKKKKNERTKAIYNFLSLG